MSNPKIGAGALGAAFRAGLKDLQQVVLTPLPDSMQTVTEPGSLGTVTPREAYEARHGVHGPEMNNPEMPEPTAPEPTGPEPTGPEPKMDPMPSMPMPDVDLDKE